MLIEAIARVGARSVRRRRVAEQTEQERVRIGGIPVLAVVDDGIEKPVKLRAVEAASERRDQIAEIRLRLAPTSRSLIHLDRTRPEVCERLGGNGGGKTIATETGDHREQSGPERSDSQTGEDPDSR